MSGLPEFIASALSRPVDYSPGFSRSVAALRDALSAGLGLRFVLDGDMNYNAAQSLTCKLSGKDEGRRKPYEFDVRFYVSSRAPLFAVYCFDRKWGMTDDGGVCHPIAEERLPAAVIALITKAKKVFVAKGLKEVEHRYFFLPAPGCRTQLADLPANVFEGLFAEIV